MSTWTADERETIVRFSDAEDEVRIWSSSPRTISKLRAKDEYSEVDSVVQDGGEIAEFTIPKTEFDLARAVRRRMSAEEREKRGTSLFRSPSAA